MGRIVTSDELSPNLIFLMREKLKSNSNKEQKISAMDFLGKDSVLVFVRKVELGSFKYLKEKETMKSELT